MSLGPPRIDVKLKASLTERVLTTARSQPRRQSLASAICCTARVVAESKFLRSIHTEHTTHTEPSDTFGSAFNSARPHRSGHHARSRIWISRSLAKPVSDTNFSNPILTNPSPRHNLLKYNDLHRGSASTGH